MTAEFPNRKACHDLRPRRAGDRSFAVTGSAITQQAIHAALACRAEAYRTPDGLVQPFAFNVAAGRKPQ